MFGSNIFSSLELSTLSKKQVAATIESQDLASLNLQISNAKTVGELTVDQIPAAPEQPTKLSGNVGSRSKQRLEQLKETYKGGFVEDMFPVKE